MAEAERSPVVPDPEPVIEPDTAVTALEAELEASLVLARAQLAHIRGSLATVATYLAREARPS